jgi:hypothetical protein
MSPAEWERETSAVVDVPIGNPGQEEEQLCEVVIAYSGHDGHSADWAEVTGVVTLETRKDLIGSVSPGVLTDLTARFLRGDL